ncbi:hypothetical protein NEUTE1DRAFT_79831 [Neurospora tetrasperma FGSC 2508]|uniref:Uncharacterized protein n=1 Tax=Neurospora tetrasperma (strain FGSC 2508 / ATCC MYA-4615 / P0657) TaxID=510951 RepID=F8MHC1_NEUT8|nr:uncharacterized protein NEUTE1DRAFT_79831 [Neurospora tetrasperma FGSC 2508]EGO59584.1 hypothetical protein NEUTE1DRAFT_79831 [Neurospora tetrasperma FGSC 2508]EGZ73712.1 hypothetical protein NEUTE2DRAFT_108589 [Neurospora tetrasperma FGSC 2509]
MVKTREEAKDMWWKVMAKILLAEHRERREKEAVASTWERASAASVTESTSRPSSAISFVSSEGSDCSLRPEDCFSTIGSRCGHSQDGDQESPQPATSHFSNPKFDEWYAEWFSHWVLETSRKLRSPESEDRFSCYSFSSSAAPVNDSDHHEDSNASHDDDEITDIRTRPSTPTPLSSPTISPLRGRDRYRCLSLSRSSSNSSPSPTRNTSIPSSPVAGSLHCPRRYRSPSPILRRGIPSPLDITNFPLPPPSTISPVFPTSSSSSSSSRSSSPTQSPQHEDQCHPEPPQSPQATSPPIPRPRPRPLLNAKTEDYLSNAHLLRFPATVSARLMMTAETLGVAGEGKRKLVSELQRTPTPVMVETKWKRRASEEVKAFDWGFGMGGEKEEDEEEEEGEEEEGYETY